ncbi:hypothetical protein Tco_0664806 [Tanacetum coccineum]
MTISGAARYAYLIVLWFGSGDTFRPNVIIVECMLACCPAMLCFVSIITVNVMKVLKLIKVARETIRLHWKIPFDFVSCAYCGSLLLTPLCCDDIHDVTPCVSALAGCDRLASESLVIKKVEEKMTLKEVDGQTVKEIETKIIAKDGTVNRVLVKFQGNPMNEFAPHRLPQPEGNMNVWLIEDEEEVEKNEVDSDLEFTANSKPVWKKTTKADHDRESRNCPYCSK